MDSQIFLIESQLSPQNFLLSNYSVKHNLFLTMILKTDSEGYVEGQTVQFILFSFFM